MIIISSLEYHYHRGPYSPDSSEQTKEREAFLKIVNSGRRFGWRYNPEKGEYWSFPEESQEELKK